MLVIRADQMAAFAESARMRFLQQCATLLRRHYPEEPEVATPEDAYAFAEYALGFATAHGILAEANVFRLAALLLQLGEELTLHGSAERAKALLADPGMSEGAKLELLEQSAVEDAEIVADEDGEGAA